MILPLKITFYELSLHEVILLFLNTVISIRQCSSGKYIGPAPVLLFIYTRVQWDTVISLSWTNSPLVGRICHNDLQMYYYESLLPTSVFCPRSSRSLPQREGNLPSRARYCYCALPTGVFNSFLPSCSIIPFSTTNQLYIRADPLPGRAPN